MEEWEGHARQKPEPGQRLKGGSSLGLSLGLPHLGPQPLCCTPCPHPWLFLRPHARCLVFRILIGCPYPANASASPQVP